MKRLLTLFILAILAGAPQAFCNQTETEKDSLLQSLDTLPANASRLETLYKLAYLDPMSPSCAYYLGKLLDEAIQQNDQYYQCLAMYAHVVYYYNHQDEENTERWMEKLSQTALEHKYYDLYFGGKRADITMHILKRKIEYSITQAEDMFNLAQKLNNAKGMSSAKLCLMTAYMMTARFKEGEEAAYEAYRLLPPDASLELRRDVLQEIALSCSYTKDKRFMKYLQEYRSTLEALTQADRSPQNYSYLLMETLYADHYLKEGKTDEARPHLKKMDEYFSPTSYVPCRGLYYNVYSHYYRMTQEYDKAIAYSDTAVNLLAEVSDNEGLSYQIERAGIFTDAGRADESTALLRSLLAKKDSLYRELSISQTDEIYQMRNMYSLLLEKEQYKAMIHYAGFTLIAIALLILIPSVIRIYYVRKKLKKEEDEIRELSQIAEEANEVKSRFLTNMSYNIRIPLNNVLGFSQLMTTDPESMDASQWKEYSEIIQTNSAELIQLVNDVLDLSRLEAGRTKWQIQEHEIISMCSDILGMVCMRCEDKIHVDFRTEIESQPFQADIARLTQLILSTLIYSDPCEEKRKVSFFLERDRSKGLFIFRIVNSPLADPTLQTQKVEVRHSINQLTIAYFKGTYTIEPDAPEGPTLIFTHPYNPTNNIQ